jgi:hypothetical protein
MAAQPANTDIQVFRRIRSFRQMHRHESVAALIKRLRPLVMSIPADEILVEVKTRDTTTADFSPYMGEARHNATRGFPIVIGLKDQVSFANAQTNITEIDFGFQIGHDKFLSNTVAGLTRDLHEDTRGLTPDVLV